MLTDEKEAALNSIMQDLAELQRSCRPAMSLSDLGKPKTSSPKNQLGIALNLWHLNHFVDILFRKEKGHL